MKEQLERKALLVIHVEKEKKTTFLSWSFPYCKFKPSQVFFFTSVITTRMPEDRLMKC